MSALDAADGSERWHYEIDTLNDVSCYTGSLGVADGTVYTVGCHQVHAIDENGDPTWVVDYDRDRHRSTVPAISGTGLYFGGDYLVRRDRASGNLDWQADIRGSMSPPVLGEEYVFVGASTGSLHGVDRSTSEVRFTLETAVDDTSIPVFDDGVVYIGTESVDGDTTTGHLYAADVAEQRWLWHVETGPHRVMSPVVHDDTVFVTDYAGTLYAIGATDGTIRWTFETGADHPTVPRVGANLVYVASGSTVHAVDVDTGNRRPYITWNDSLVAGPGSPPLVTDEELCIGTSETRGFYAFDLS